MKRKENNTMLYVLVAAAVVVMAFSLYVTISNTYYGQNYQKAIAAQNPSDICATPAGYTDEQWRTHMSHHPDMYAGCLG